MLSGGEFRRSRPELAEAGRALFYQFGVGLAFLATVRRDGGPRVHPMCPIITDDGLFAFIIPSPKRNDLVRDGRYAMHGFPPPENEDAIYLTGTVLVRTGPALRQAIAKIFLQERKMTAPAPGFEDEQLFEFLIESCLLTKTTGHGDYDPQHTGWRARSQPG